MKLEINFLSQSTTLSGVAGWEQIKLTFLLGV